MKRKEKKYPDFILVETKKSLDEEYPLVVYKRKKKGEVKDNAAVSDDKKRQFSWRLIALFAIIAIAGYFNRDLAFSAVKNIIIAAIAVGAKLLTVKNAAIAAITVGAASYAAAIWIVAKNNPKFAGEIALIGGGAALTIGVLFAPLAVKLFIVVLSLPLLLLIFAAILLAIKFKGKIKGEGSEADERGIIYQVPNNHRWILRNVWYSNPKTLEGYQAKPQGYRIKIPFVWHKDEGLVSLVPVQEDPQAFTVNCKDGNPVEVDARVTYYVRDEEINGKHASLYYIVNTKGEDAHKLVHQRVKVALNRAMNTDSESAISWTKRKKENFGRDATIIINDLLRNDKPEVKDGEAEAMGKDYGLAAIINVQNIRPTETVQAAKEREAAAKIEEKAAEAEANAVFTVLEKTGANPTAVVVAQTIADMVRPLFDKDSGGGKKTKKEEKNEKQTK